jgi:25S rRNA (adenine2142-N1)-methyltransferase
MAGCALLLCIIFTNSRYMTLEHMKELMDAIGFSQLEERSKPEGKMIYWLYQKRAATVQRTEGSVGKHFRRKKVLRQGGHRNVSLMT